MTHAALKEVKHDIFGIWVFSNLKPTSTLSHGHHSREAGESGLGLRL